jgi:broad specificity phosphatase PhoE
MRIRIVLARHGRPDVQHRSWIAARDMPRELDRFNRAEVWPGEAPASALETAASSAVIVSSTLMRSVHSARCLAPNRSVLSEDIFCEAGLPHTSWRWPRLPFVLWVALFRVGWFCGFSAESESLSKAGERARAAAQRLIALAEGSGSVFLVGHGIINGLIARQLLACGALGPKAPTRAYWGTTEYELTGRGPGSALPRIV